ncbi:DUF11 domain-containing protein [Lysobacter sp. 5GHs7-4]|uniref:beta strand repeat-containing protein n=1 Tax=Lysobacter sp. 5GHs7-4 TaxID=2904253 RepID=UPI001E429C03|nr:DUF11 domain-containing protein [Lysobacter sp. 5GHs7-4]UHQ23217.1 DUF11 domain-containing protein [Lysobacter sp. 5GHs7-4]
MGHDDSHSPCAAEARRVASVRFAPNLGQGRRLLVALCAAMSILLPAHALAQTVIYRETFNNGNANNNGNPRLVNTYVGPGPLNMTYTADPAWLTNCNGLVTAGNVPANNAVGLAACPGSNDTGFSAWSGSGIAQKAVGAYNLNTPSGALSTPGDPSGAAYGGDIGITAWTASPPTVGSVILQNAQPIPFPAVPPGGTGRFVTFQFVAGAASCNAAHPLITVNLNGTQLGGQMDLCTGGTNVRNYNSITNRAGAGFNTARAATFTPAGAGSAVLVTGGGLTFTIINQQASGIGNDYAYDNFTALDVTPSVTKAVDIASNYVGQVKRLTFTITNTSGDNGAKVGWGFTDTLPGSVVIAPTPNATTTCGAGTTLTANAGDGTFTVAGGNLPAGTAGGAATTCTVSVNVTSNTLGTFTNTQASYTSSTALNIPNQSVPMTWVANTVTVTKISNGATGTFDFSGSNGIASHQITTTAQGAPGTAGALQTLTLASTTTTTTLAEAALAGWTVTGTPSCTVGGSALAGVTYNAGTRTLTLPALPLVAGAGRNVLCTFTNTVAPPALTVTKISNGGTDTFGFSGNNGIAAHNITTTAAGAPGTAGAQQTLTTAATATAITENAPPAGWVLSSAACTVTPPGGTAAPAAGTFDAASRTFNLTAADTAAGNTIACTFSNALRPTTLTITKITQADNGGGPFNFVIQRGAGGGTTNQSLTTTAAGASGAATGATITLTPGAFFRVNEGLPVAYSVTDANCVMTRPDGTTQTYGAIPTSGIPNEVIVPGGDVQAGSTTVCTFTNTRRPRLQITKLTAGDAGGPFSFTAPNSGFGTLPITTTAAGAPGTTAAARPINIGFAGNIVEAAPPAGWAFTDAACTVTTPAGVTTQAQGPVNVAARSFPLTAQDTAAGNAIACTFTNQRQASLQLAKAWAAGSTAGHQVSIGATTGGANNTAAFDATAPNAADSGAPVAVSIGDTVTLPAEGGTNAANYTTALACTGGHTLSGNDGQQANTLTITSANAAVCTYTNTLRTTDLSITKTNTSAAGPSDQADDTLQRGSAVTYTLVVTNNGPATVTGAVVRDAPGAELTCAAGNPVTITGNGVPSGSFTVADLTGAGGIVLGQLNVGQSATLRYDCTVN